jgi:hypothetical protein
MGRSSNPRQIKTTSQRTFLLPAAWVCVSAKTFEYVGGRGLYCASSAGEPPALPASARGQVNRHAAEAGPDVA